MQQAMDVEILNSYLWLDEYKPELYKQVIDKLEQIR
ncbi:hypothetical protein HNQ91_002995 [Filimonas zeae]|nr:hypothetical protein [Filimonas zeae]